MKFYYCPKCDSCEPAEHEHFKNRFRRQQPQAPLVSKWLGSYPNPVWNDGLGKWVNGERHRKQLAKEHGLEPLARRDPRSCGGRAWKSKRRTLSRSWSRS